MENSVKYQQTLFWHKGRTFFNVVLILVLVLLVLLEVFFPGLFAQSFWFSPYSLITGFFIVMYIFFLIAANIVFTVGLWLDRLWNREFKRTRSVILWLIFCGAFVVLIFYWPLVVPPI